MLYLIECSSLVYRMFHGLPDMRRPSDDHPIAVAHGCASAFWRLVKQHPSHVAVVLDRGKSQARLSLHQDYKAQRPPIRAELACQFPFARRAAEAFGFRIVEKDGVEADDLIATHARLATAAGHDVVIVSIDKDMMQLIGPNVIMFDPLKNRQIGEEEVLRRWGVKPQQMVDLLAMSGDASDNIKGMHGVGPKKAAALLEEFGSLDDVIARSSEIRQSFLRGAVQRDADKALFARALIKLDAHVDVAEATDDFAYNTFDTRTVLDFLDEMELVTLRDEIATGMLEAA